MERVLSDQFEALKLKLAQAHELILEELNSGDGLRAHRPRFMFDDLPDASDGNGSVEARRPSMTLAEERERPSLNLASVQLVLPNAHREVGQAAEGLPPTPRPGAEAPPPLELGDSGSASGPLPLPAVLSTPQPLARFVSQDSQSQPIVGNGTTVVNIDDPVIRLGGASVTTFEVSRTKSLKCDEEMSEFSLPLSSDGEVAMSADTHDLKLRFRDIAQGAVHVDAENLYAVCRFSEPELEEGRITALREVIRTTRCVVYPEEAEENASVTDYEPMATFKVFRYLMLTHNLEDMFDDLHLEVVLKLREMCVKAAVRGKIRERVHVGTQEFNQDVSSMGLGFHWLEPLVAFMILLNALVIGISLDVERGWAGWDWCEVFFTVFFLFEFCMKVKAMGWSYHFLGPDWSWNMFDFIIVILALVDLIITAAGQLFDASDIDLNTLTLMRLARLIRITRLVKLLRLKVFKELTLMVNGVIGGIRTLFWAIVLLMVLVYVLGVLMRQLMEEDYLGCQQVELSPGAGPITNTWSQGNTTAGGTCTWGQQHLLVHHTELFSSVTRAMFTVFRCFTDGCTSVDGVPLILAIWDAHGLVVVVGYVLAFLFVSFGVFNLIMAIFVENTLEYARTSDEKRQQLKYGEHIRAAQTMQQLVMKFCGPRTPSQRATSSRSRSVSPDENGLRGFLRSYSKKRTNETPEIFRHSLYTSMNVRVDRDTFEEAVREPAVIALLDKLEIGATNRDKLFDILDADGNGYVAISELIDGLMKLRGPADKGDIVAASLMIRSMQKSQRQLQTSMMSTQDAMYRSVARLEVAIDGMQQQIAMQARTGNTKIAV